MDPPIPANYIIGEVSVDGDSFFSSVAQGLEQVRREEVSEKMLRQECKKYAQHCAAQVDTIGDQNITEYIAQIEYCANECNGQIMGRPDVEGQIINKVFEVNIYIIEKQGTVKLPDVQERQHWLPKIIDESGYRLVERIDYEVSETIYIIDEGGCDYKPILKIFPRQTSDKYGRIHHVENEEAETETFEIRAGTSGASGHFYEIKLLMLYLLRLQETDKFYLARNMAGVGAFDDVVIQYQTDGKDGDKINKTIFLQAKHSEKSEAGRINIDSLLSAKGAFSLKKYHESYREIKRNFRALTGPIFNGKLSDSSFIIFTNYLLESPSNDDKTGKESTDTLPSRWVDKEADRFVISKGNHSKQLNINTAINQDIIQQLSRSPVRQLAQEIYLYTFGTKKHMGIKIQNEIFQEYHIYLANEVFTVEREEPSNIKFSDGFVTGGGRLWKELFQIANKPGDTEETFLNNLRKAKVNLFKTFGNYQLALDEKHFGNFIEDFAKIIRQSESNLITIDNPSQDIMKLANNVLVRDDAVDNANEQLKFSNGTLIKQAKKFMEQLQGKLDEQTPRKDFKLMNLRFQIKGFPKFTLPGQDEDITEDEVKDFLSKLEFVCGQQKEKDLDDIIKQAITSIGVADDEINIIFQSVKQQVESWWKYDDYFLTKQTKFVENARNSISHFQTSPFEKLNKRCIEITRVAFKESVLTELKGIIEKKHILILVADEGTTLLSSVKICQTMDGHFGKKNYIFMQLNHLLNIRDHVLRVFQSTDFNFLVIESNSNLQTENKWAREDFSKLCEDLLKIILRSDPRKKVILITEQNDRMRSYFENYTGHVHKEYDRVNLSELTAHSQKKLVGNDVMLHGKSIKMRDVIDIRHENAQKAITSKMMMSLINKENFVISSAPQFLSDLDAAYVKLYEQMPLGNLVKELSSEKNIMFFISGMNNPRSGTLHDELMKLLQITNQDLANNLKRRIGLFDKSNDGKTILIIPKIKEADPLKEFRRICSNNCTSAVYWVEIINELVWLQEIYEPNFYMKRKFVYVGKTVLRLELICQKNPSSLFIFNDAVDMEKVEKLAENLYVEYQRRFQENCENKTIIFAKSESDADNEFAKSKSVKTYTHRLKINGNSKTQFIWHRSNGSIFDTKKDNLYFQPDLLIQENSNHTFIFDSNSDKQKAFNMVLASSAFKKQQFHENCKNGSIIFSSTEKGTDTEIRNVHWLQIGGYKNEQLIWKKSHGSLEELRDYIDKHRGERKLYNEEQFSKEIKDKVVIIADEPGMGKTTSLTSVSQQMLDDNWVIRINFQDCEDAIDALPTGQVNFTVEDVYNFLSTVACTGLRNDAVKQLMLYELDPKEHHCRPIIIMSDGYDEISSNQQETIMPLLQFIKYQTSAKLWVTTRLHMIDTLENSLSVFATGFEALALEEQTEFFNKFWNIRFGPLLRQDIKHKIGIYSSRLLDKSANIIGGEISRIMGVPLQLRLLAEGLTRDVANYLNSCDDQHPNFDDVKTLNVYQRLIKEKYDIFVKEKKRIGKMNNEITSTLLKDINKCHERSAFRLLFPDCDFPIKPIDISKENDLKSVGIIQSMGKDSKPFFIHRTFAEYFVANLLVRCLGKKDTNPKKYNSTIRFIMKHVFAKSNRVIHDFMDRMLSEDSLIDMATLDNKVGEVLEITGQKTHCIRVDKLGRTAMHLATQEGHCNIVDILLDYGYDADIPDVLGRTTLHYAVSNHRADVIYHPLLHYLTDINIAVHAFSTPLHYDMEIGDSLFICQKHSSSKLLKFVNQKDLDGKTAFQYSINIDRGIACALILHGANIGSVTETKQRELAAYFTYNCAANLNNVLNEQAWLSILGLLLINWSVATDTSNINAAWDEILGRFINFGHTKVIDAIKRNLTDKSQIDRLLSCNTKISYTFPLSDEDHLKVAYYLLEKCGNKTWISIFAKTAARNGNLETLKYILKQEQIIDYNLLVFQAIVGYHQNIVSHLYREYSQYITNYKGDTALHFAAKHDRLKIVKHLVNNDADVDNRNLYSSHFICNQVFNNLATLLPHILTGPASVNARNSIGKTPVQYAVENYATTVVTYLVKHGAIISHKFGHSIHDYARICRTFYDADVQTDLMKHLSSLTGLFPNISGLSDYEEIADNIITHVKNNVNYSNEHGTTLLHIAATFQTNELPKYLIKQGADINIKDREGRSPLHKAVQAYCQGGKNNETLIHLLACGAIYNRKDNNGQTVFDYIKKSQADPVFRLMNLLEGGFKNVNTLFHKNTDNEQDQVKKNERNKAIFNARNSDGNTLIHLAALSSTHKFEDLFKLYESDSNWYKYYSTSSNHTGNTPLHFAAAKGEVQTVKRLIRYGCPFNSRNIENHAPKEIARINCHTDVVQLLQSIENTFTAVKVNKRCEIERAICEKFPNATDEDGKTMLHWAAWNGHVDIAKLLIQKDSNIEVKDNHGWKPLHNAAQNDQVKTIELLFHHCAIFNPRNKEGKTPLEVATGWSLKFLEQITQIYYYFQIGNSNIARNCLKSMRQKNHETFNAALRSRDNFGNTFLHYAAAGNEAELVQFLLESGAPFNARNKMMKYPIHRAHNAEIINLLRFIESMFEWIKPPIHDVKIMGRLTPNIQLIQNARNVLGNTILHAAVVSQVCHVSNDRVQFFNILIENGFDINATNKQGSTPLDLAIQKNHFDYIRFLVKKGAQINNADCNDIKKMLNQAAVESRPDIAHVCKSLLKP